ncbi:hypothetical protein Sango_3029000 [Sesamum angolense]|uniref:Transposase n=1 Tax=Sesamum angolense TaxID=2727404 RepID=A0AAE1T0F3_9LAMI|nr:hypothetical protein Sango_3029000 [Sesamum angolense]
MALAWHMGDLVRLRMVGVFVEKQKVNKNLIENESVGKPEHIDNNEGEEEHSVEQPSIDNKQSSDDGHEQSVGEDSDFSDRLVDSEFELSNDDIIFDSNIDPDSEWRGFHFNNSINVEQETSELGSQFSDGTQSTHHGHPIFNKRMDVENPKFELGMCFSDTATLRQAIKQHSIVNRRDVTFTINDRHKVQAKYRYKDKIWSDTKWPVDSMLTIMQKENKLLLNKSQLYRTKKRVEKMGCGTDGEQYAMLWSYAEEIRNSNPSTTVKIKSKLVRVVEKEKRKSWLWFLEMLVQDLNITHSYDWTIMSDKQKGLIDAIDQLLPGCEHRATRMADFERAMNDMRTRNTGAYEWLMQRLASHWSKSHFNTHYKSDILLNDMFESFNHMVLRARSKHIVDMLETIRLILMKRIPYEEGSNDETHWVGKGRHLCQKRNQMSSVPPESQEDKDKATKKTKAKIIENPRKKLEVRKNLLIHTRGKSVATEPTQATTKEGIDAMMLTQSSINNSLLRPLWRPTGSNISNSTRFIMFKGTQTFDKVATTSEEEEAPICRQQ